ncbi:MAG: S41 family peptidase [Isosphaeraceae bacterium]|nr:S41 family peptidase [Isosphaeraceae bacterium]
MHRSILLALAWLAAPGADARAESAPAGLAARAWAITDTVLDHHISPPTRQQMMLDGLRALYKAAGVPEPSGLARKVSLATNAEQFAALVEQAWSERPKQSVHATPTLSREEVFAAGLLTGVSGGARLVSAKDVKVEQQIAANRYVGLQIALGFNKDVKRPEIAEVFEGGPAHRAGVLKGDLIEEIDGTTTDGLELREVIDRLRGPEGTAVTVRIRQAKEAPRTYKITRGVLPRKTIEDIRSFGRARGDVLVDGPGLISYLKFKEILGSTPHELRQLARKLEDEGAKALVLDLRGMSQSAFHPAILLADDLLEGGTIGRLRTAKGVETYEAEPDALFRGWPLAVLIDGNTAGVTGWLAAALQDNHRAVLIGVAPGRAVGPAAGDHTEIATPVPFGDGSQSIEMITGRLERADGRPLARQSPPPDFRFSRRAEAGAPDRGRDEGVVPDIAVAPSQATPRAAPRAGAKPEPKPAFTGDAATAAALRHLREALKLPQLAPGAGAADRITLRDEVNP